MENILKKINIIFISIFFISVFFISNFNTAYADTLSDWNTYVSDTTKQISFGSAPDYSYAINSTNNTYRTFYYMTGGLLANSTGAGIPTDKQSLNNNGGWLFTTQGVYGVVFLGNTPSGQVPNASNTQYQYICYQSDGTTLTPSNLCNTTFGIIPNVITTLSPIEGSNINAYFTVSGVYNNDGTYNEVDYELFDDTTPNNAVMIVKCQNTSIGVNLTFNCHYMGLINNSYHITAYLHNNAYSYPFGSLIGAIPSVNFTTNSITDIPTIGGVTCSTFDIGCYVVKGIQYLFLPDTITSSRFTDLIDSIKNKPPIGYITGTITALGAISATATPTLALASFTPLNTLVFMPIRTGLIFVLWIAFLFVLFKKFGNFQL